jgi:hypothetical protein
MTSEWILGREVSVEGELAGEDQQQGNQTNLNHDLIIIESVFKKFLYI